MCDAPVRGTEEYGRESGSAQQQDCTMLKKKVLLGLDKEAWKNPLEVQRVLLRPNLAEVYPDTWLSLLESRA
jgi:hypothetical protein